MASLTRWTWVWVNSGVGDGQGGLVCCDSWDHKQSDTTERLNWLTDWVFMGVGCLLSGGPLCHPVLLLPLWHPHCLMPLLWQKLPCWYLPWPLGALLCGNLLRVLRSPRMGAIPGVCYSPLLTSLSAQKFGYWHLSERRPLVTLSFQTSPLFLTFFPWLRAYSPWTIVNQMGKWGAEKVVDRKIRSQS